MIVNILVLLYLFIYSYVFLSMIVFMGYLCRFNISIGGLGGFYAFLGALFSMMGLCVKF
jgi:hypothetical protein